MGRVIEVDHNLQFFRTASKRVEKQIPFAMAKALTETVQDVQEKLREDLPSTFTIRSPWTSKGIRIQPARKNSLVAKVGSRDEYMVLQARGGTATGKQAIPVGARPQPRRITRERVWPRNILKRGGFIADAKHPWLEQGAVYTMRRGKLKLMWRLRSKIEVPKRWALYETFSEVVQQEWVDNVRNALLMALMS